MLKNSRKRSWLFLFSAVVLYALIAIALYFADWLPTPYKAQVASGLGISERFLSFLSIAFTGIALSLGAGFASLSFISTLLGIIDRLAKVLDSVVKEFSRGVTPNNSELSALREEIKTFVVSELKGAEDRLRSEWRFVVGLIAVIVLGIVPILFAVLAFLTPKN